MINVKKNTGRSENNVSEMLLLLALRKQNPKFEKKKGIDRIFVRRWI